MQEFWFRTDRKCHGDGGGTYRKKFCRSGDTIFSISYFWKCDRDFLSVDEFYETGYAKAGALGRRSGTHRNSDDAGGDVCGCEPLPDIFLFGISVGQLFRRIGYNSASIFTTNNFKQSLLAWTQFVLTKDPEFRRKGIMYTMTVLSFFVGACIGCVSVYTYGAYGAFIGFVPLIVARLFMYIGKIPVENGTPEETEEEAKEALEEANLLENDQKL